MHPLPQQVLAQPSHRLFRYACHKRRTQHLVQWLTDHQGAYHLLSDLPVPATSYVTGQSTGDDSGSVGTAPQEEPPVT